MSLETESELDRVRQELERTKNLLAQYEGSETQRPPEDTSRCARLDSVAHYVEQMDSLVSEVQGFRLDLASVNTQLEGMPSAIKRAVAEGITEATIQLATRVQTLEHEVRTLRRWREDHEELHAAE